MSKGPNLTPRLAAQRLGVSLHHLYELIWTGKLAARRVDGRWQVSTAAVERRERETANAASSR